MKLHMIIAVCIVAGGVTAAFAQDVPTAAGARAGRAGRGTNGAQAGAAAEERAAKREANQEKRIEMGIKHGQLTPEESTKLQGMEANIKDMETKFNSDGKLNKDEAKQLGKAINEASVQIWAERHDTEGNQKVVSRLGKDVFAQDSLTSKIESGEVTKPEARKFLGDFRKMVNIKHRLANDASLTAEQRTKLQEEYNTLLNQYFTIKTPTASTKAK